MKNLILALTGIFLVISYGNAQVKIGGNATPPPASAVLEIDGGDNKGLLLPRMRKQDIDAIQNPAEGLTIYATDEQAVYLRKSLVWEKQSSFSLPAAFLLNSPSYGLKVQNTGNGDGLVGVSTGGGIGVQGFVSLNGYAGIQGSANSLNGIGGSFFNSAGGRALVTGLGRVGLGIFTPQALLHIDGTNESGTTIIINDDDDPSIQFRKAGINKSYIKQEGNNLVFRPNDQNSSGKVILQSYNNGGWLFVDAVGNTSLGIDPNGFAGTPYNSRMNIAAPADRPTITVESPFVGSGAGPSIGFVYRAENNLLIDLGSIRGTGSGLAIRNNYGTLTSFGGSYTWKIEGSAKKQMLLRTHNDLGMLNVSENVTIGAFNENLFPDYAFSIRCDPILQGSKAITVDAIDPIVNLKNNTVDKGFIQLVGDDIKMGTYAANDLGNFVIRTNGSDRIVVRPDGKMVLGSPTGGAPVSNHLLAVKGRIAATEFTVVAAVAWPDYVFAPGYQLKSLEETAAYIKANNHLPNLPAAAVIEKEGFGLGEMQKLMMEKIEELTLHLIEVNREIQLLKKQMADK